VFPFVSQRVHTAQHEVVAITRKSTRYLLMIGLPIAMMTTATADRIITFVFNPEFAEASTSLAILIWFIPIVYLTNLFGHVLGAADEQSYVLCVSALNLVFNITVNIIVIPSFAQVGAAVTTVLTELVGFVLLVLRIHRRFGSIVSPISFVKICIAGVLPLALVGIDLPILVLLAVMVIVYAVLLIASKALSLQELRSLLHIARGARETV
jgi:O-antigen/teichoic acid export membrane protein